MRTHNLVLALLIAVSGCNMPQFTADTTADVLIYAPPALNQESDVQFAREAAPAQLKTVEGFLMASPKNKTLLRIVGQGYCEYAFGFLEPEYERLTYAAEFDQADLMAKRVGGLYLRCMNYSLRLFDNPDSWEKALYGELEAFEKKVAGTDKDDVPALFFTALGLGSAINLNRDNIDMVAYLPMAMAMFKRVLELDETFYNGGAHLALGMMYTAQGKALGGNPKKGLEHFQRANEIANNKYLMTRILMAREFGVITQNRRFFHNELTKVLLTSPAVYPEERLANELAHQRAKMYLTQEKEWF